MNLSSVVDGIRDAVSVRRVFGDPVERDGVTVIPVARVRGGGGGGSRPSDGANEPEGGVGFGMVGDPVGVFVIRDGDVHWQPAFDLNRVVLAAQIAGMLVLMVILRLLPRRR